MIHATIRPATLSDLDRMVEIEIEAARIFPLDVLPADIGRSGSRADTRDAIVNDLAWVAEVPDDGVVGFLSAEGIGSCLHVSEMDVLPSHARHGIGGQLLENACAHAAHVGLHAVTLTTFANVPWNAPFYAKHGFMALPEPLDRDHLKLALDRERARGLQHRLAMVRPVA